MTNAGTATNTDIGPMSAGKGDDQEAKIGCAGRGDAINAVRKVINKEIVPDKGDHGAEAAAVQTQDLDPGQEVTKDQEDPDHHHTLV